MVAWQFARASAIFFLGDQGEQSRIREVKGTEEVGRRAVDVLLEEAAWLRGLTAKKERPKFVASALLNLTV